MGKCGTAGQATDGNVTQRMLSAYWITKGTNTHSEYEILTAFLRQQWSHEGASKLRLYAHCMSR